MPRTGRPPERHGCEVDGCPRKHYGQGYCRPHYYRWNRTGHPGGAAIGAPRGVSGVSRTGTCQIESCNRPVHTRGYCNGHYLRLRAGKPLDDKPLGRKVSPGVGGRWSDGRGYIMVTIPSEGRRISEHRWLMEQHLGRRLLSDESVHHRNGIKDDNRIENLELWSSCHPTGSRVEDLVSFAEDILARYG